MNNYFFISILFSVWIVISIYIFYTQKKDINVKNYFLIKSLIIFMIISYLLISIFYFI